MLWTEAFPSVRNIPIESDGIARCCLNMNDEIKRHIRALLEVPEKAVESFLDHHQFEINTSFVVQFLHQHLVETLSGAKRRDIFVSVYLVPGFIDPTRTQDTLLYHTHMPINRDLVVSREISLAAPEFAQYECVKCISTGKSTVVLQDTSNYHKSDSKRHKRIRHYIGMKLAIEDRLIGFLNVELYEHTFFPNEKDMVEYVEQQLLPFRYLLEYQLLKRTFFSLVESNLSHGGVTNG